MEDWRWVKKVLDCLGIYDGRTALARCNKTGLPRQLRGRRATSYGFFGNRRLELHVAPATMCSHISPDAGMSRASPSMYSVTQAVETQTEKHQCVCCTVKMLEEL